MVDTQHFLQYLNLRKCCLIVLDDMLDNYLVETVCNQLQAWLCTPYRAKFADNICREVPKCEELRSFLEICKTVTALVVL